MSETTTGESALHTDPNRRHDFVLLFDVTNGNPNGDPDAGNMPRTDPETRHGLVTDVALKRKVRDYVSLVLGKPIFIQSQVSLNTLIVQAFRQTGIEPPHIPLSDAELLDWFEEGAPEGFSLEHGALIYGGESPRERDIAAALNEALEDRPDTRPLREKLRRLAREIAHAAGQQEIGPHERMEARAWLCQTYYDVRMFGAVLSTGLNAGQVRGPAQVMFARSIDPIMPLDLTITRQARTTAIRMETGPTEMGRKPIIPYGLYRAHGFFSPALAQQTGVTVEDLETLWEALGRMFEFDRSAARGEMTTRGLYVFTHDSPRGNAPAHKLFERIRIGRRDDVETPRAFDDYTVRVEDSDLPDRITLTCPQY